MENFKAKSDDRALRFSKKNDSRCASFIQFMFSSIVMAIIPNDLYMLQRPIYFLIYILCAQWRHLSHQIEKLTINTRDIFLSHLQYVYIWLFSMKFSGIRGSTYIVTHACNLGFQQRVHPWAVGSRYLSVGGKIIMYVVFDKVILLHMDTYI